MVDLVKALFGKPFFMVKRMGCAFGTEWKPNIFRYRKKNLLIQLDPLIMGPRGSHFRKVELPQGVVKRWEE